MLLVPLVSAVPQGIGALKGAGLEAAMTNAECKTDFMVAVIDGMVAVLNDTGNLSSQVDILNSDIDTMQGYVDANDTDAFRAYVHGTYAQHMRDAKTAIKDARKGQGFGKMKQQLKEQYDELKSTYDSCHFGTLKHAAETKVDGYKDALGRKRQKIQNLSAKGINTTELDELVDEAENEVVDPLENEVGDADNVQELKGIMDKYCLYNGCKNGTDFHFAAKFEIKKLGLILDNIKADAESKNLSSDVETVQGYLDSAQSKLDAADESKMDDAAHEAMWSDIKAAESALKLLVSKTRSG